MFASDGSAALQEKRSGMQRYASSFLQMYSRQTQPSNSAQDSTRQCTQPEQAVPPALAFLAVNLCMDWILSTCGGPSLASFGRGFLL